MLTLAFFVEFVEFVFRPLIATVVMATSSYVLGTVVGYQFHMTLLRSIQLTNPDFEKTYMTVARRFYEGGFVVGLATAMLIDSRTSSPLYYLIFGGIVCLCWLFWLGFVLFRWGDKIQEIGVRWHWVVSSLSLAFASAFIGATFVSQWFQWMEWRQDVLKW